MLEKVGIVVAGGILVILLSFGISFISAAFLMVALDLVHNDLPIVPELGFLASWGALFALATIGSALRGSDVKK